MGMGTKLISKFVLENEDYNEITKLAGVALDIIRDIKNNA